ncbi:hypothetical protein Hte_007070 [Hypoxylon texense]
MGRKADIEKEIEELDAQIERLEEYLDSASKDDKKSLQQKIQEAKKKKEKLEEELENVKE